MKWPEIAFSKLAEIVTGNTPPKKNPENYGPGVPWVKPPDLDKWEPVTATEETLSLKGQKISRLIPVGTVMVSCIGSIGRVGIAGTALATNQQINSLIFNSIIEPRFGYYYCKSITQKLQSLTSNAVVPILNKTNFSKIKMPLPPISEQHRIVEILDQVDRLRKLRADADAKIQRILPALFIKMFGNPVANKGSWNVDKLGNVGTLERGKSKHRPRNDPILLGGPYPLIQTGDVANSGGRIRNYTQTYSDIGLSQSRMWPRGTLCITIAANIARTGVLEFDACFPDSIVGFHPGADVTIEYVQAWLWFLQPVLENNAPQAAQKNINLKVLRDLPIPIPPKYLQDKFSGQVKNIYQQKNYMRKARTKIEILYKSLLHNAFTGDLTASWREAHMKKLLQEMELQAKALAS
ncbi:MAG: type I restriction enzyme, S subunit [Desulfobacteraceae bacterium Eth-SRB2]|nr:MAG: type I restriction enzyme, S subunit [Desulfobacteraceae bacterium Eth-SRB2]